MNKKIIFAVTNDLINDQRMQRICESLSKHDYEVELIGRRLPNSKNLEAKKYKQHRLFCFFTKGKLFYIEYNIRLFFYLLSQKTDAICAIDLDTILPVFVVTKIKSIKCIYDAHEYFTEVPEVINRPLIKRIWKMIASYSIPKIKYCYTVSESLRKLFSEKYNVEFQLIRNVASKTVYLKNETKSLGEKPILWYQGALNEGRGLENAIEAMQYLNDYGFWLAGEGDLSLQLRQLAIDKNVANRVKFLGMLSPNELSKYAPNATLGIHFTENKGLSYYYSLANRTFDYIHAELPSIHPDFPEYRAIIEKYEIGELLSSYEPQKIAIQLRTLIENTEKMNRMKAACKAAQAEFCWENEEIKLLKFYKCVFI